jgi:hypothetical protein
MLPLQHHASFSTTLKGFMVGLYARLKPFPHKINPLDYAMNQKCFPKVPNIRHQFCSKLDNFENNYLLSDNRQVNVLGE